MRSPPASRGKYRMPPLHRVATPAFPTWLFAALAQKAGLLLLTCNLKHFQPLGVACVDPLIALPQV